MASPQPQSQPPRPRVRSASLAAVRDSIDKAGGRQDLVVERNETRILSYQASWSRPHYREIRPKGVDEVKEVLGVPDSAVGPRPGQGDPKARSIAAEDRRLLRAKTVELKALSDRTLSGAVLAENLRMARAATRNYIYGSSAEYGHWRAAIEEYLNLKRPVLLVPFFNDVVVNDGATLQVAADTHAVYANRVRLFGSGRIECQGPTTFDCASFEGYLP